MAGKHPVTPLELKYRPPAVSDYPDLISDTETAFGNVHLIPDVVDTVKDSVPLKVDYGTFSLENAMTIDPGLLLDEPSVDLGSSGSTYTLMLVDADAPSPNKPQYRCWLHWMAINIPALDVKRGEEVLPYEPPDPAHGQKHRCAFLVFRQDKHLNVPNSLPRKGFQVRQWCKDHGISPEPAAGMFFWCQEGGGRET